MAAIKTFTDTSWIIKKAYYIHIVINTQGNHI